MKRLPSVSTPENTDSIQKFIGTGYDNVRIVADNIGALLELYSNLDTLLNLEISGGGTNIGYDAGTQTITSSTGVGAIIPVATAGTAGLMSATDKSKLDGVSPGATANSSDASLRDRSTHTGVQDMTSVSGLIAALAQKLGTGDSLPWGQVSGKPSFFSGSWDDLSNKPISFTPSAHGHDLTDISGLVAALAGKQTAALVLTNTTASFTTTLETKLAGIAAGATANATDAALRDRATHTGTQAATTITGLAAVATSGSATDLSAGTLPAARFNDTAHGARAGGTLHADATTSVSGFMSGADKTKLNGIATGATANATDAALRDRATHTGTQPSTSISDFAEAVDDRVGSFLVAGANITLNYNDVANTLTIAAAGGGGATNLAYDTATRVISSDTGNDATLPLVSSIVAGLAPASGGGTSNFLRADGTWAAPPGGGGGGSPGGSPGEIQWNNAGSFAGAADVEIEGGQLRLPVISLPAAPAANGLKMFGRSIGGRILPATMGPSGLDSPLQPHWGLNSIMFAQPLGNSTSISAIGIALTATGTATAANWASTDLYTQMRRVDYLVTTAAATAVAGVRNTNAQLTVGGNAAERGGFHFICRWGLATGGATATHRAFCGLNTLTGAPTDSEPSGRVSQIGMGWDAADANIQFMHNDGTGTCTKIDLGASFPVPTADRQAVYEIAMFSPPGTTQSVSYRIRNLTTGAEATGTVTTDLPTTTTALTFQNWASVGGTSSVIGTTLFKLYIETDY